MNDKIKRRSSFVELVIYTTADIASPELAAVFFQSLEQIGFTPEYLGYFEPIKIPYSFEKAIEMWTHEDEGCYDDVLKKSVGKAGLVLGRNRSNRVSFMAAWWKWPGKKMVNWFSITIPISVFLPKLKETLDLFTSFANTFSAVYGYIAHVDTVARQHATGRLENRLPGVFWCNYFSKIYVDFFEKEKMLTYPWYQADTIGDGLLLILDEHPYKNIIDNIELEEAAKFMIGYDSFANHREEEEMEKIGRQNIREYMNSDRVQHKRVPNILM